MCVCVGGGGGGVGLSNVLGCLRGVLTIRYDTLFNAYNLSKK